MSEPTDWKAIGLDFHSPFEILSRPRAPIKEAPPKPKKEKPAGAKPSGPAVTRTFADRDRR